MVSFPRLLLLSVLCFSVTVDANTDPSAASTKTSINNKECIIVLHGMGRTAYSMDNLTEHLQNVGYTVWNQGYPSLSGTIEELAQVAIDPGVEFCRQQTSTSIHFVTHSLGGILLRFYLQERQDDEISSATNALPELGKIVMLSPPNHGSEVINELRDWWLFRAVMGPAALQLATDGFVQTLKPIPGVIGIITGNESSDPWFSGDIPGPDDGKVSVESAKLDEMADFLVMPVGHTFIMTDESVLAQIEYFFVHGQFRHPETAASEQSP